MKPTIKRLAVLGDLLNSLDCLAYLFLASTLGYSFFSSSAELGIIYSLVLFGISRLLRPVGGFLMDYYPSLFSTHRVKLCLLTALPTFCIGLLPTQDMIGNTATGLFIALTLLHGITKPLWMPVFIRPTLWQYLTETPNIPLSMTGSFVGSLFFLYLTPENIQTWGWRLPFLLQMPLALGIALFNHHPSTLTENHQLSFNQTSIRTALTTQKKPLWLGGIIATALVGSIYTLSLYLPVYLTTYLTYNTHTILFLNGVILGLGNVTLIQKLYAHLYTYYGNYFAKGISLTLMGLILCMGGTYPLLMHIQKTSWLYIGITLFGVHFCTRLLMLQIHEILHFLFFKDHATYSVSIILCHLPAVIVGSMTPFICSYGIHATGVDLFPAYYSMALNLVALMALFYYKKAGYHAD